MLLFRFAAKGTDIASMLVGLPSEGGWTQVGSTFKDGSTNSGNGTGSVAVGEFYKIAASASETAGNLPITNGTTTQAGTCIIVYQKGASDTWETPVGNGGGDASANTSFSATIQSHISVTAGDMVDFFMGIRDDTTMTVPTITQTGVTFDTVSEQPATAGTNTSGADGAYDGGYRLATAGTSSAAAVITGTLTTSETGSGWMTRLRVTTSTFVPRRTAYHQLLPR